MSLNLIGIGIGQERELFGGSHLITSETLSNGFPTVFSFSVN